MSINRISISLAEEKRRKHDAPLVVAAVEWLDGNRMQIPVMRQCVLSTWLFSARKFLEVDSTWFSPSSVGNKPGLQWRLAASQLAVAGSSAKVEQSATLNDRIINRGW